MINFKSGLIYCVISSLTIPALVILIVFSVLYGNTLDIISFTLFGSSILLFSLFNTLYYWITNKTASKVFLKFKHVFSYFLIASAYTTICLGPLIGPWGWSIFGVVWGLSILGIVFSSIWANIPNVVLTITQILIASVLFIAVKPLFNVLSSINCFGLLLFIFSYIFYITASILKSTKIEKLDFLSNIFTILGLITNYLFILKYLLFI